MAQNVPSVLSSGSRDLNPAVELGGNLATSEQAYLIYYANETDPASVNRLAEWLSSSKDPEHQKSARRLHEDAKKFPRVVSDEILSLMKGVVADSKLGLIVFSNSLAKRGLYQFMDTGDTMPTLVTWPVFQSQLKVFQSHPLAHPQNIDLALRAVVKRLQKRKVNQSSFILVAKSHGSRKFAIAQSFAPLHEAKSAEELMVALADLKSAAERSVTKKNLVKSQQQIAFDQILSNELAANLSRTVQLDETAAAVSIARQVKVPNSGNAPVADTVEIANADQEAAPGTAKSTLDAASQTTLNPVSETTLGAVGDIANSTLNATEGHSAAKFLVSGTTKEQFIKVVLDAGELGMRFNTVFLEACQSELPQSTLQQARNRKGGKIGRLFTSSVSGLRYRTFNYSSLFANRTAKPLTSQFATFLNEFATFLNEIARRHLREGMPADADLSREFSVIAHRGASGYLPEHTLEAYSLAYGMGADYIEQDVVLTKDNQAIVLHDIHLDTVTNVAELFPNRMRDDGRYYAIDFTMNEIRTLSTHERVNHETGQAVFDTRFPLRKSAFRIPTLADAIELVQGLNRSTGHSVGIYPEIKKPKWHRDQGKDISRVVLQTLGSYGYQDKSDNLYLQCFDPVELRRIRKELKCELKLVQLIGSNDWNEAEVDYNELATDTGLEKIAEYADGIGPWLEYIVKERMETGRLKRTKLVSMAHRRDLIVHPFTLRKDSLPDYADDFPELVRIVRNTGADGVFTDHSDRTRQALQQSIVTRQLPGSAFIAN